MNDGEEGDKARAGQCGCASAVLMDRNRPSGLLQAHTRENTGLLLYPDGLCRFLPSQISLMWIMRAILAED